MSTETQAPCAGTFCWNEVMTRDVAAAEAFYTKLFGWTAETNNMPTGPYCMFKKGDKHTGGMMGMEGPQFENVPPHWLAYVAVDDVEASAKKAEELGGKVIVPATHIPGIGRFAIIQDPTGAVLGIFQG